VSLDARQLLVFVVRPVLAHLGLPGGEAAERLVLATAAQESDLRYIDQKERTGRPTVEGPALGLWQMERATFADMMRRFLPRRAELEARVLAYCAPWPDPWEQLAGNAYLSAALCRVLYYSRPFRLKGSETAGELWLIYKRHYNSMAGAATAEEFHSAYARHVAPLYPPAA
jgi:hypothetical protein